MKKVIYYCCVWLIVFTGACIGIADLIAPINESDIYKEGEKPVELYRRGDSLRIPVFFRDNSRLDSIVLNVRRKEGSLFNTFKIDSVLKIRGGRAFEQLVVRFIPPNAELGKYEVVLVGFDYSKNRSNEKRYDITIEDDAVKPVIESFKASVNNVPLKEDGTTVVCRLDVIKVEGRATDNIIIREVRANISGGAITPTDLPYRYDAKEIHFSSVIGSELKVPATATNGSVLTLKVGVADAAGNRAEREIKFIVDCDDQAPLMEINRTNPPITLVGSSREVRVVEGSNFQVLDGRITDEKGLKRLTITMGLLNIPNPEVLLNRTNFTSAEQRSITFQSAIKGSRAEKIDFSSAQAGQTYELLAVSEDISGNVSVPYRLLISILKDELPNILITDFYIDNIATRITSGENSIRAGQTFRIEGKIIEDFKLQELRISWGIKDSPQLLVNLKADKLTNLPFDFSSAGSLNSFTIPSQAPSGALYELKIEVKDNKNPVEIRRYFFKVQ